VLLEEYTAAPRSVARSLASRRWYLNYMNRKYNDFHITIALIGLLSIMGCSPVYKLHHYNADAVKGWAIVSHNIVYTAFTSDDHGFLPDDEDLAKSRFERRKNFLEQYYKIQHPGTKFLKELPLLPVGIVLFPVFIVDEYRVHVFNQGHEISDKERDEIAAKRSAEEKILKDFITTDMQQETTPQRYVD